jgi:hypothetical protein
MAGFYSSLVANNGRLPPEALAPIKQGQLEKAAAAAWNAMNVEARRRGCELLPNGSKSSYRTYAQQVELYALYQAGRGSLAAHPGTSNHGWGLAVDVATLDMRAMIDRIGTPYGWAKRWSDAQSEWWHIKYTSGHYTGPDPGPEGRPKPKPVPKPPEGTVALFVATMKDGRFEVFVEDKNGQIWHAWQDQKGGWAKNASGKTWSSLGTPGK